jgi:hypothetical protein
MPAGESRRSRAEPTDARPGRSSSLLVIVAEAAEDPRRALRAAAGRDAPAHRRSGSSALAMRIGRADAPPIVIAASDLVDGIHTAWTEIGGAAPRPACADACIAAAALRVTAARMLAAGGPLAETAARLQRCDQAIAAAADAERARHAAAEALLAHVGAAARRDADAHALRNARRQWHWLLRIEPLARERDALCTANAALGAIPADLETRCAALDAAAADAERRHETARNGLDERLRERAALEAARDPALPRQAGAALQLSAEIPAYRARLLELAATRARAAEVERSIAEMQARLRLVADDAEREPPADTGALLSWQERVDHVRRARAGAAERLAAADAHLASICADVQRELSRDPAAEEGDDSADARWRRVWHLRRQLEEIWEVQSRAESDARTVAEREQQLAGIRGRRIWLPGRRVETASSVLAVAAALAVLWSGLLAGALPDRPLIGGAAGLVLVRLLLFLRARIGGARVRDRDARGAELERELDRLRWQRDRDWARAAELSAAADAAARRLGLPTPTTLETVDAHEQALATALRAGGGSTALGARLCALFEAEEAREHAAAVDRAAAAAAARAAREWEAWRAEVRLPPALDAAEIADWLAARGELAAARAAHAEARRRLAELEPAIAAWERTARTLIGGAGHPLSSEVCGRALAAALSALAHRVRAERQRRRRRARIEIELQALDAEMRAAAAAAAEVERARAALRAAVGAADDAALDERRDALRSRAALEHRIARLDGAIECAMARIAGPVDGRTELARGTRAWWEGAMERVTYRLAEITSAAAAAARGDAAAAELAEIGDSALADLRAARERVRAEQQALVLDWQRHALAAALLDHAVGEYRRGPEPPVDAHAAAPPESPAPAEDRVFRSAVDLALAQALRMPDRPLVLDHVLGRVPRHALAPFLDALGAIADTRPIVCIIDADERPDVAAALPPGTSVLDGASDGRGAAPRRR